MKDQKNIVITNRGERLKKKSWISALALLSQLGIAMAVPIFGCMLVGNWIDEATGKSPLWLVVFIVLGVGAAFRNLFHIMTKEIKKGDRDE